MSKVEGFQGRYQFLSNMFPCTVIYKGLKFSSSEAAYQAAKCKDVKDMHSFLGLSGYEAKKLGKTVELREDWEQVKRHVMREIVMLKFKQNRFLAGKLIATGSRDIIEVNTWNDQYWGVCRGLGQNHLGKILMEVRSLLAKEKSNKI